jgi:uncharacterized membrane protein
LEIQRLISASEPLRNAVIVVYSLVVMATILPGFDLVSRIILIPYYLLIPGFCVTQLLRQARTILDGLFFSVAWSIAIITSVVSIEGLGYSNLSINIVIPVLTVVILALVHYRR